MHYFTSLLIILWFGFRLNAQSMNFSEIDRKASEILRQGDIIAAEGLYKNFLFKCNDCNDSLKVLTSLKLFTIYMFNERLQEAFIELKNAEKIAISSKSDDLLAQVYIKFAEYYRNTSKYQKAEEYLSKTSNLIKSNKVKKSTIGNFYNRKAAILQEGFQDYKGAIAYSLKNIKLAQSINDKSLEAISINELGFSYENLSPNLYSQSLDCYKKAIHIWDSLENHYASLNSISNVIRISKKLNLIDQAITYNQLGLELAEKTKSEYWTIVFTYYQYEIYRMQGNIHKALLTLEKHDSLNTDYNTKYRVKAATKAEIEYEARIRENAIKINELKLKNRDLEIERNRKNQVYYVIINIIIAILLFSIIFYFFKTKKKNKELNRLLEENKFLLGESNHRIKNNLQLIIALLYQEMESEKVNYEESILFRVAEKIEAVSTLHKQLYTNESKEIIRIDTYLDDIKKNFEKFFTKQSINMEFHVDPFEISINKSLYLGILFTELILNSLKHAFKEDGIEKKIIFTLQNENDQIILRYSDTGSGFNSRETRLKLVHMMSQQMRFDYKIEGDKNFNFYANLTDKF